MKLHAGIPEPIGPGPDAHRLPKNLGKFLTLDRTGPGPNKLERLKLTTIELFGDHRFYETEVEIKTVSLKAYSLSDTNTMDKCNNTVS